jgi:uncharacterized membrane protein HdeD (DUF308 family)
MSIVANRLAVILSRAWWVLLLRGVVAIAFGALTWFQPGITLAALVMIFGAYTLVDGVLGAWAGIAGRKEDEDWWVLLLGGLIGIGIGLMTFLAPGLTALGLLFYIAVWAIATGVLEILAAIRLRKEIEGEWRLVLGGLVSVAFGALLMARPGAGALAVLSVIAIFAVVFGILRVLLAFKVRKVASQLKGA